MDYEIFKEVVIDKFKDYLPDEFSDMKIETSEVRKVNRTLDAINIIGNSKGSSVVPTIYINDMYDMYQKTRAIDESPTPANIHGLKSSPVCGRPGLSGLLVRSSVYTRLSVFLPSDLNTTSCFVSSRI